jgi:hypothetical protein
MIRTGFTKAAMVATLSLGALAAPVATASAQDVFSIEGPVSLQDVSGRPDLLLLDFLQGNVIVRGTSTGAFAGLAAGANVNIMDLQVANSIPGFQGIPMANFMSVGGYTFTLTGVQSATLPAPGGLTWGPIAISPSGNGSSATFNVVGRVTGGAYGAQGATTRRLHLAVRNLTPTQVFNQHQRRRHGHHDLLGAVHRDGHPRAVHLRAHGDGPPRLGGFAARRRRAQV